jgi:1-acylglycerone phosphate reductase
VVERRLINSQLITGGVATKFVHNFEPVVLPEDSMYHSIKDIIEHQPDEIPLAVKPDVFAQQVFAHVRKGSTGKVWVGGGAGMARWSYWLFPEWAIVSSMVVYLLASDLTDGRIKLSRA